MGTSKDHRELTEGLGLESDCPLCGYSWPGCRGLCVAHVSMTGSPGPFHDDYNDDCELCQTEERMAVNKLDKESIRRRLAKLWVTLEETEPIFVQPVNDLTDAPDPRPPYLLAHTDPEELLGTRLTKYYRQFKKEFPAKDEQRFSKFITWLQDRHAYVQFSNGPETGTLYIDTEPDTWDALGVNQGGNLTQLHYLIPVGCGIERFLVAVSKAVSKQDGYQVWFDVQHHTDAPPTLRLILGSREENDLAPAIAEIRQLASHFHVV